jgi:hypothetical protein
MEKRGCLETGIPFVFSGLVTTEQFNHKTFVHEIHEKHEQI